MTPLKIPIACSINANYALPLTVMLMSLVVSLRRSSRAVLYLVHQNLPAGILQAIATLVELHPISFTPAQLAGLPSHPRFPPEAASNVQKRRTEWAKYRPEKKLGNY
jgi:hypothetical protein